MSSISVIDQDLHRRATASLGVSAQAIYRTVSSIIHRRHRGGGTFVDVGCGTGSLLPFVRDLVEQYVGVDAVHYQEFPLDQQFVEVDLDSPHWPVEDEFADVCAAVETI